MRIKRRTKRKRRKRRRREEEEEEDEEASCGSGVIHTLNTYSIFTSFLQKDCRQKSTCITPGKGYPYSLLDWTSNTSRRKINLPTNQKGYDKSETTDEKLLARRIQIFRVYFSLVIF